MSRKSEPGRREAILSAARIVFQEHGFARSSMTEISRRSGVAHGTVYLYFKSKLDIADALCDQYYNDIAGILLRVVTGPLDSGMVRQAVHKVLEHAAANSDVIRYIDIHTNLGHKYVQLKGDIKLQSVLRRAFREGIKSGEIRKYDPAILAELVGGLIEWITKVSFVRASCDVHRYEETAIRMLEFALLSAKTD